MKNILAEWNPWWSRSYAFNGVRREKLQEILPWIKRKEITAIIGVRRAGKTTLLYEIIEQLLLSQKVLPEAILFIKADDDRVNTMQLIDRSIDEYKAWKNSDKQFYLFIDEVQEIPNWQKILKRIYDLNREVKMFISGSNAFVIKEKVSSLLAGRISYFEIFPFSFLEFLRAKNIDIQNEGERLKQKESIQKCLQQYIVNGSFPEVILESNEKMKKELIKFYFDSIFYRDVIRNKNIRNPAKMEKLVKFLLQNVSNPINFSKTAKLLDLSTDSITEYVKILEDAYLLFNVSLFEFSYKKQIINPKKIYCVDTGIRNIVGYAFSEDKGRLYENIVFLALRRKYKEIYYWKNKQECDFVVKSGKEMHLVQVCATINEETKAREENAIFEALKDLHLKKGFIITEDYEIVKKRDEGTIIYVPLWKWLSTPSL